MRRNILIIMAVIVLAATPTHSHAFGILRWGWDAIANQLGLDRGPIPKVMPKPCYPCNDPRDDRRSINARCPWFYIQADGF